MNIGYFEILPTNTDSHLITAIILSVTANDKQSKRTSLESLCCHTNHIYLFPWGHAAAAAKSLQSCPTLCNPIDGSSPGSTVPGILQARTLEWVAISFSNAWKWKVKVKSLRLVRLLATPWTAAYQTSPSMGFSRQEYWSGLPLPSAWGHVSTWIVNL